MKRILLFIPVLLLSLRSTGQSELTLPYMEHVFQSTYYNPAAIPDHKVSIGLPGISSIYAAFANSGFSLSDIDTTINGKSQLSINKLVSKMSPNNFLNTGATVDIFHIRIKARRAFVSFNIASRSSTYFSYPQDLGYLLTLNTVDANGKGRDLDLSNIGINSTQYIEYAIGYTRTAKAFTFGVRLKLLQGLANAEFNPSNLILKVDSDMYGYSFNNSASMHTSIPLLDTSGSVHTSGAKASDYFTFKNIGFATDFGITYAPTAKWSVSLAVNNIGFINWKNNAIEYNVSPNIKYQGVDVLGNLVNGSGDLGNVSVLDSLKDQIKPKGTYISSYQTWLVPRAYFTGKYNFTPRLMLAATLFLEQYKTIRPAFVLGGQYKIGRILSLTASGSYQYSRFNLGGGFVLKPGPVQFYLVTDNLNAIFDPVNSKAANVRLGFNLVFGQISLPQKQAFNKE